jgi:hypothetical protein
MKKIFLALAIIFLFFNLKAQIKMASNGYVSIGSTSTPSKNLDISGSVIIKTGGTNPNNGYFLFDNSGYYNMPVLKCTKNSGGSTGTIGTGSSYFNAMYASSFISGSDIRFKENIKDINNALEIVLKIKGVKYDLKNGYENIKDTIIKSKLEADRKNKIGFIAQDLKKVLPEVVVHDDSTDMYGIDYSKVVAVIVEAIKEQQTQIDSLKKTISKIKVISTKSALIEKGNESENYSNLFTSENKLLAILDQNAPNPFNQSTLIRYYLPVTVNDAKLFIYDMNGLQLKSISINSKGKGSITINGSELNAGMYIYTLIADGVEVDTKRMILTR